MVTRVLTSSASGRGDIKGPREAASANSPRVKSPPFPFPSQIGTV